MIRIKHEVDDSCISSISGENLCLQKTIWIAFCVLIVALMIVLRYYKKKNVNKK